MSRVIQNRMAVSGWDGDDCEFTTDSGGVMFRDVKDLPGMSVPVRLCFELRGIPEEERREIDVVVQRMTAARESEADIKLVVDEMKSRAWAKMKAFDTKLSDAEIERIASDYARAYRDELKDIRRTFFQQMAMLWLIPAIGVYGLGWSVGWVWRGFRKPTGPAGGF
jgi:hypothetical protein